MLIIEDGTGLPDAQSYVDATTLSAYAASRGETLPATPEEQEALLLRAMDYLETLRYEGVRANESQALEWPRRGVMLFEWYVDSDKIPTRLQQAQMQLAIDAQTADLMSHVKASATGAVLEQRVEGAVAVKYAAPTATLHSGPGAAADGTYLPRAAALLRPLVRAAGVVTVRRG